MAKAVQLGPTTLVCDLTAYHVRADGETIVGRGRQVQRVLPKEKLKALIARATP